MRKALVGIILAATVLTPVAAEAQRGDRGGRSWSNNNNGGESNRAPRSERVNEAPRQSEPVPPPPPQEAQRPRPQPQVAQRRGGDGTGNSNRSNRGGWNGGGDNDGNRGNRGDRGRRDQPSIYPQAWQGNPNDPRLQRYRELERRNQNSGYQRGDRDRDGRGWRGDRNDRDGRNWRDGRNDREGRRGDRRNWRNDWNRGWRNDNRYNWGYWRGQNRNRYRLSPYYSPYRNWSYRRFSVGLFLDSLFYSQRYWIGDPWQYRLPAAPYGTQWVRYYNDVVLVDVYTGEVIDVIHDFFW